MYRIDFYPHDVLSGKSGIAPKFSYYGSADELPIILAEWITLPGALAPFVANVTKGPVFTTWWVETDSVHFPRIAVRPVVPVH